MTTARFSCQHFRRIVAKYLVAALVGLLFDCPTHAFNPPEDTVGPLTVKIADPGAVTSLSSPLAVPVTLQNSGDAALSGTLRIGVTEDWSVQGVASQAFALAPRETRTVPVAIMPGKRIYEALYPVHAFVGFQIEGKTQSAHAILILSVSGSAIAPARVVVRGALDVVPRSATRLDEAKAYQVQWLVAPRAAQSTLVGDQTLFDVDATKASARPAGWGGTDVESGTVVQINDIDRGEQRRAIAIHPPWRTGWGEVLLNYRVKLPAVKPVALEFATAIRDSNPQTEAGSDGVDFRVYAVQGNTRKLLWNRFSAAKKWQPARVDLSAYAGREITLQLFTGPGPSHNTSSDQAYWAEPAILSGLPPKAEAATLKAKRRTLAQRQARAILNAKSGTTPPWSWRLQTRGNDGSVQLIGASLVPGPRGLADAFMAFANKKSAVVFEGFELEISGQTLGAKLSAANLQRVSPSFIKGRGTIAHKVLWQGKNLDVRAQIWAEAGALRIAFAMPGVKRDVRGHPRFTRLAVGPASQTARRVYAGFGNVLEKPGDWTLGAGGFTLSTRHVGMDFEEGLSLVQASEIFPDAFEVKSAAKRYALVAHHDTTFSFVPSSFGAFDAARKYRQIARFKAAGGVSPLLGRMCLDQWGGDYAQAAQDIERAARYGLADTVFVKHVWQRWGYDYRLPEIYPPSGNFADFKAMADAAQRHGMLFCPHDNYIDFYPDAKDFSYDHILFNEDGTPQKAWFNEGRQALSYRWLPTAFMPWLDANLKAVKNGFAPTGYFIDVFTAIPPIDFYDRAGKFYPKTVTQQKWGAAFDRIREILGNNAPTISEAGTDALIGHLDGAQSDHSGWVPKGTPAGAGNDGYFRWEADASDGERVPWHDMVSHNKFVLLAGGLGNRYAGGQNAALHGYGSDDYLSLTVLGGRNPMSDGPFNRRAVMTYWLLHDVCAELAKREMISHRFVGNNIHRQSVQFSGGAKVEVNRSAADTVFAIKSKTPIVPRYGFQARAGTAYAEILRRDGVISAMSQSPGVLFVDARPPVNESGVRPRVLGVEAEGRRVRVRIAWDVLQSTSSVYRPFLHFVDEAKIGAEGIAFQAGAVFNAEQLTRPGTYESTFEGTIPENLQLPAVFAIRFGMYNPNGGERLSLTGPLDNSGRVRGGSLQIAADGSVSHITEPVDAVANEEQARLNLDRKILNFGAAKTNGVWRLKHTGQTWELMPLPFSDAFGVELDMGRLGMPKARLAKVAGLDENGQAVGEILFVQVGVSVKFEVPRNTFKVQIQLAP